MVFLGICFTGALLEEKETGHAGAAGGADALVTPPVRAGPPWTRSSTS